MKEEEEEEEVVEALPLNKKVTFEVVMFLQGGFLPGQSVALVP